jgi:hypothetical protein
MTDLHSSAELIAHEYIRKNLGAGSTVQFGPDAANLCVAVTPGVVYYIEQSEEDGDYYFLDDEGEPSYAINPDEGVVWFGAPTDVNVVPY